MDMYNFYMGRVFDAYEYLGAHIEGNGVVFRTYAPNAGKVNLFYKGKELPMKRIYDGNFYELRVPEAISGDRYEYRIYGEEGCCTDHCDPYGFRMELRPAHKSLVCDLSGYTFHDSAWMKKRRDMHDGPMNIYEMHLGSWRRKVDGS